MNVDTNKYIKTKIGTSIMVKFVCTGTQMQQICCNADIFP